MTYFPAKIEAQIAASKRRGKVKNANTKGKEVSFFCGVSLEFSIRINKGVIESAGYLTNGCGHVIAYADFLCEVITDRRMEQIQELKPLIRSLEDHFDIPTFASDMNFTRAHCLSLCVDALSIAFSAFRQSKVNDWEGESPLICSCFGIDEATICKAIKENKLDSISEIGKFTNAGTGCGSCQLVIEELIDATE